VIASSSVGALQPQAIGRYDLLLELGRGGMAVLYLARAQGVGGFSKLFAIKQILPHLAVDPPFVDMFLNEGRIAARLSHPNLCAVFELGQDRGELFLVMEYLDGVPWEALAAVAPRDARGLALTAGVLAQACEGLHYAHTFRDVDGTPTAIVHRDVSPQNLFVSADGVCRVLDFGVSKIASDRRRTGTGLLKGKLPYMAPEQIQGEPVDPRADIWAMGVMLWEALTGERLFDRDTDFLTYQAIVGAPIPSVNAVAPGPRYPAAIDAVIARALGRDRDTRYPTARDLARDLQRVAADAGGAATREQIADAVVALCGDKLDARRRAIAAAISSRSSSPPTSRTPPVGVPTTRSWSPLASEAALDASNPQGEAAETISMMMRRDAIVVARPRRKRWRTVALALAAASAAVAGIAAWRAPTSDSAPDRADAVPTATSPAPAATAPVAAPVATAPVAADTALMAPTSSAEPAAPVRRTDVAPTEHPAPPPRSHAPRPVERAATGKRGAASTRPPPVRAEPLPARLDSLDNRPAAPSNASGWYAIDSNPYATIFIDGRKIGDTPLDRISLSAGTHQVRAVLADGSQRTFSIDIAPDRRTSSGTLTW
jgi:eukaryotic-like serine/threonine-protein kinase